MARVEITRSPVSVPAGSNRFRHVLDVARVEKAHLKPLQRPSLAEEFFRENPMPWLLDKDPVD